MSEIPFHPSDRVLVAIMNNRRDFDIAQDKGWYRIPVLYAPESATEAAVLAFYFTRAFDEEKWAIHWYAPVRGHELAHRYDLFPDEADHPRANEMYYKMQIGPPSPACAGDVSPSSTRRGIASPLPRKSTTYMPPAPMVCSSR
jgi:hypothetical protein